MDYGLMFANVGPLAKRKNFKEFVLQAEEDGVESIWVVDHAYIPIEIKSKYPYTKDGSLPLPPDTPFTDPFVALSFAAAITERIKLATGMLLLAQRHPLHVAKAVASLDVLSNGRTILGIGIGWLQEEFELFTNQCFKIRHHMTEEYIEALDTALYEPNCQFDGQFVKWKECYSFPKPRQDIPIVIGGNTKAAARRAARVGNEFFPFTGDLNLLQKLIDVIKKECDIISRDPSHIKITALAIDPNHEKYEKVGISRLIIGGNHG